MFMLFLLETSGEPNQPYGGQTVAIGLTLPTLGIPVK